PSDVQPLGCHPHPGKPVRGSPKALLRVPDPDRGQLRPTRPIDDLLIKTDIEVGLVMIVPSKVHLNLARPDQAFEGARDKPGGALAFGSRGAGRIMAEYETPARLATQCVMRGVQLVDTDHGLKQTGVDAVDVEPGRQERNGVMGVRQAPAVAVER